MGAGGSSPRCAPRWCCCSCSRWRPCPARCCRSAASTPVRVAAVHGRQHPDLAPWYDRLSLFDVFSSPWFAAIYLLLFVSLVGCVLPRSRLHLAGHARPAAGARRATSSGCRSHAAWPTDAAPRRACSTRPCATLRAPAVPRRRARRTRVGAEKGYLRETGNLVFHLALLACSSPWRSGTCSATRATSWSSRATAFSNTRVGLRHLRPRARFADESARAVHGRRSRRLTVRYQPTGDQRGRAARLPGATVRYTTDPDAKPQQLRPAGQPPAGRRRHQGVPARQRLRPGVHGARQQRRGRVLRARCRSCRRTATSPRPASSRSPARSRSSSASRASSCRPRSIDRARSDLGLPGPASCRGACSAPTRRPRRRRRRAAVGLHARHHGDDPGHATPTASRWRRCWRPGSR